MKLGKVINPRFHEALMKLSNQDLPVRSAKKVLDILRIVKESSDRYHKERLELLQGVADKSKKGELKLDKEGNASISSEESRKKFNEKLNELMNQEVLFDQVKVDDLGEAKLSAQELSLLEELFY